MSELHTVTVIFYKEKNLKIRHDVQIFRANQTGRIEIPLWYRAGKCIIAICDGSVGALKQSR